MNGCVEALSNGALRPLVHFFLTLGILTCHVQADDNVVGSSERGLLDRIMLGPDYFTTMDKVLFGIIILLAMEALNYIAHKSGGQFNS
eukprot:scaffold2751_cov131-Cylindrotheca_fusiformis.AAC.1